MELTVIIPAYNAEATIKEAIESVPEEFEVVVVNDGSTDRTEEMARRAKRKCRIVGFEKNKGVGAAVNRGIAAASSSYFTFLGSDDKMLPGIKDVMAAGNGEDLIYYDIKTNNETFHLTEETKMQYCGSTKAIKKSFVQGIRVPEIRCEEDYHFFKLMQEKNPTELFTGIEAKYYDFPRKGSLTWKRWNMPKITFCMPAYNAESTIRDAIRSAKKIKNAEIVICDDASTDGTLKVAQAEADENVRIIKHKKNQGVGKAFNSCIDVAEGEYIIRLDADDRIIPEGINQIIEKLTDDIVYFDLLISNGRRIAVNPATAHLWCGLGHAIRRSFIGETRAPEIRCGEDWFFHQALMFKGPSQSATGIAGINYNHPRQGSLCDIKEKAKKSNKVIVFYYPLIIRGGVEMALKNLLQRLKGSVDGRIFVVYRDNRSSMEVLNELKEYAEIIKGAENMAYADVVVECSIFHRSGIAAGHRIQWVHCVTGENVYADSSIAKRTNDCDTYIAVSKAAQKGFKGSVVFYNDIDADIRNKSLEPALWTFDGMRLLTVSRVATVKGFDRMPAMCKALEDQGIKYEWLVIGNGFDRGFEARVRTMFDKHNVKFIGSKANPYPWMKRASYCVQLSDSESFGLSTMEAQILGTPSVVTDYAASKEVLRKSAFYVKRDMSNINEIVAQMATGDAPKTLDYEGDNKKWIDLFNSIKPKSQTLAVVKRKYMDLELDRLMKPKETFRVKKDRGEYLRGLGLIELIER